MQKKDTYGLTRGQKNALKYSRIKSAEKYHTKYGKTYKRLSFSVPIEDFNDFNDICKKLNLSRKELVLKEIEVLRNE